MPFVGGMFDTLRVRFDGTTATYELGKTKEQHDYSISEQDGSEFKLVAKGGMFDGAKLKLLSEDELEVTDQGDKWPGVTVLRRVR